MPQPKVLAQSFRLPINCAAPAAAVQDLLSNAVPFIATGAALEFDLAFSDGAFADATILDLSVFDTIEFRIQGPGNPHANTIYIAQSIAAADFQALANAAAFTGGTGQQVTVAIPGAANILSLNSQAQGNYWLCIYGTLSAAAAAAQTPAKATGDPVPLCYFQINVVDSGIPIVAPQLPLAFKIGSAMPFVCSDGQTRDVTIQQTPTGRWSLNIGAPYNGPGQAVYSLYCSDATWRDISLQSVDGVFTLAINQTGHS